MSIRLNTTGYVTSIGDKEAFGENNIKLRVSFKTEREHYANKYTSQQALSTETKYDTLSCIAYGKVAEYIYSNYTKLKNDTKNSDVRVELYGYLEADNVDVQGSKIKFVSKLPGQKEQYNITIPGIDEDLFHRITITRLVIKEITFIDIERVRKTAVGGGNIRSVNTNRAREASKVDEPESDENDIDSIYKELEDKK